MMPPTGRDGRGALDASGWARTVRGSPSARCRHTGPLTPETHMRGGDPQNGDTGLPSDSNKSHLRIYGPINQPGRHFRCGRASRRRCDFCGTRGGEGGLEPQPSRSPASLTIHRTRSPRITHQIQRFLFVAAPLSGATKSTMSSAILASTHEQARGKIGGLEEPTANALRAPSLRCVPTVFFHHKAQ